MGKKLDALEKIVQEEYYVAQSLSLHYKELGKKNLHATWEAKATAYWNVLRWMASGDSRKQPETQQLLDKAHEVEPRILCDCWDDSSVTCHCTQKIPHEWSAAPCPLGCKSWDDCDESCR